MSASTPVNVLTTAKGILFDMDGVLVDSEPAHAAAILALSGELGEPIRDEAVLFSMKGAPEKFMAARLSELYPHRSDTADELIARKGAIYAARFDAVKLIPGAFDFLRTSHAAGRRHGLTTSASRPTQRLTFETFGLDPYFEAVVTGEDIVRGKPDPEPYLLTASRLGLSPAECVVFEDSIHGVRSGKAAGCTVIALTTTFPREALLEAGADFLIPDFTDLG